MNINVTQENDLCRMRIEGGMTIYSANALKQALLDNLSKCSVLELDLSGVDEMDTSGFQLLLLLQREAELSQKSVRVDSLSQPVNAAMTLYNMMDILKK